VAGSAVNGSGKAARAGGQTLELLTAPIKLIVLRALSGGPQRRAELRRQTGFPAQTTLRGHLRHLEAIGVTGKHQHDAFPGTIEYELERSGEELLEVADILERWLAAAPDQPLGLGTSAGKAAIKALVEGWSTGMLRALAAQPLSLTELDRVIPDLSYPSVERRLGALRLTGLAEAMPINGKGTPYTATAWLRRGIAPLTAAVRWERRNLAEICPPIRRVDIEAIFLLATPLLSLPNELSGSCRMAVELSNGGSRRLVGAMVGVEEGLVVSCTSRLQGTPNAWASGPTGAWLTAIAEADRAGLEIGGDGVFAGALLDGLHATLFRRRKHF
jgi:DNA-binding HxlR family transcriptional regulator